MEKRNIILIITATVLVLLLVEVGAYYTIKYVSRPSPVANLSVDVTEVVEANSVPTPEEIEAQNKIDYPDIITGIVYFSKDKNPLKSSIKTSGGTEYILSPNQPYTIYETFGVRDGDAVQIQGKILENNKLSWVKMESVQK